MKSSSPFSELDAARYWRILCRILQRRVPMAIYDAAGEPVWLSDDNEESRRRFVHALQQYRLRAAPDTVRAVCCEVAPDQAFVCRALAAAGGEPIGWLGFLPDDDSVHAATNLFPSLMTALDDVGPIMENELLRLHELMDMAQELGERYDELSILSPQDGPVQAGVENRDVLSRYTRQCVQHISADLGALWIKQRDVLFPAGEMYRRQDTELNAWLQRLVHCAYQWFLNGYGKLGINTPTDQAWPRLGMEPARKLVAVPIRDAQSSVCGVLVCARGMEKADFRNSDRKLLESVAEKINERIHESLDELTGMLNRYGFQEHIRQIRRNADARQRRRVLGLLNLNQFKVVNASYGIAAGDEVLRRTADCMAAHAGAHGIVARLDADNFGILLEGMDVVDAARRADELCRLVAGMHFEHAGRSFGVSASVGLIDITDSADDVADLISAAELALLDAKEDGVRHVQVYQPDSEPLIGRQEQLRWVERVKYALLDNRFVLYCQRILPLGDGAEHYEVLVRMVDEEGKLVPPAAFIGVAERYGLMPEIDRWVVSEVMKLLAKHPGVVNRRRISWGINLSGKSLNSASMLEFLSRQVNESPVPPGNIYFEITETAAVQNLHGCVRFMRATQAMGYHFALDDFGSGLSSFAYLKALPVDYLKIDGSLVRDMCSSKIDQVMVSAIARVARAMGLRTIAEFVEDQATIELLRTLDVDYAQGYAVMKPAPLAAELERLETGADTAPNEDALIEHNVQHG
jgi:diguanylate cyclase (GGDEF)-like protein